jgi:hypothetical protein
VAQLFSLGHITRYEHIEDTLAYIEHRNFCCVGFLYDFLGAQRSAISALGSFHFVGSFSFGSRRGYCSIFCTRTFDVTWADVCAVAASSYLCWLALVIWPLDEQKVRFMTMWPNQSPEPTAITAAVAIHAASRRWLSFFR